MLYVDYILEERLGVNAIIDNVVMSDLICICVFGSASYHCHNWREGFVPLFCSTVLHAPAIIDSVVTSDLIRMCVFRSALYHCHNWRERFVPLCRMHRPCRVIRPDYVMCAKFLFMDVIILFPRQTRVYMLLSESLLILGICGQT